MHYSLLVEAKADDKTIQDLMFPFMEWGSSNEEDEANLKALGLIEEYTEDDEVYAYNKQGKWDWWVIGGRYTGIIPGGLTTFQRKAVTMDQFSERLRGWAENTWDSADRIIRRYTSATLVEYLAMDRENKQIIIEAIRKFMRKPDDVEGWENLIFATFRGVSRVEHIENSVSRRAITYGYLTAAGEWNECETWHSNREDSSKSAWIKNEKYQDEFSAWYEALDPETWLTVVDYHS